MPGCQFVPEFQQVSCKLLFFLVFGDVHELEEPSLEMSIGDVAS